MNKFNLKNNNKFAKSSKSITSTTSLATINKEKYFRLILFFNSVKYLDLKSILNLMVSNKYIYNLLSSFEIIFLILSSYINNSDKNCISYKYFKSLLIDKSKNINKKNIFNIKNNNTNNINNTLKNNKSINQENNNSYYSYFGSLLTTLSPSV